MNVDIFNIFDVLRVQLELPHEIIQKSIELYQKAKERNLGKKHSEKTLIVGCIYMICNQSSFPRTLKIMETITKISILEIASCYHDLVMEFELKPVFTFGKFTSSDIPQIAKTLEIPQDIISNAMVLYEKCTKRKIHRGPQMPMIAACLYAVCRNTLTPWTLKEISRGTQTSRKDIARCYRKLLHEFSQKSFYSSDKI